MTKKVLLVGLEYTGDHIFDVDIETLGLCRSEINDENAAFALYEYDLVIINPESYSHFIFGRKREFSDSKSELSKLKHQNNDYDLDTVFNRHDRREELTGAFNTGTRVIWLLADEKRESFFGWRKTHIGYINKEVEKIVNSNEVHRKKSRKLNIDDNEAKDRIREAFSVVKYNDIAHWGDEFMEAIDQCRRRRRAGLLKVS